MTTGLVAQNVCWTTIFITRLELKWEQCLDLNEHWEKICLTCCMVKCTSILSRIGRYYQTDNCIKKEGREKKEQSLFLFYFFTFLLQKQLPEMVPMVGMDLWLKGSLEQCSTLYTMECLLVGCEQKSSIDLAKSFLCVTWQQNVNS